MIMLIHHFLQSFDSETNTAVFFYRTDKSTEWVVLHVSVSPLLAYRILNMDSPKERLPVSKPYEGTVFSSEFNSPEYTDSPFNLVCFKPAQGSDVPMNYRLEAVDENYDPIFCQLTKKILGYAKGMKAKARWFRHEIRVVKQKELTFEVVLPDMHLVPYVA